MPRAKPKTAPRREKPLTAKQEAFCIAVALKQMNASDAYREAYAPKNSGDPTIWAEATRLTAHPVVALRIAALREQVAKRAGLSVQRTLAVLDALLNFDSRNLFNADGTVKNPKDWDERTMLAVQSLKVEEVRVGGAGKAKGTAQLKYGVLTEPKFADRMAALEKAMKHFGLYEKDNAQRPGEEITSIRVEIVG